MNMVIRRAIFRSEDNQSSKSLTGSSFRFDHTRLSCREHPVLSDGQMVLQVVYGKTAATWAARRTMSYKQGHDWVVSRLIDFIKVCPNLPVAPD
jgi:hypothetical protein